MSDTMPAKVTTRNPWAWIPSLYLAQGIPYVMVMSVSVVMYKRLGISNTAIALYTSWLYLPWVIKPLWSPIVDLLGTKRRWIVLMQGLIATALAMVALTIPASNFFQYTIALLWLMAFSSATHDIAADGFYMLELDETRQAAFVGIRSTFYRIAMITGEGGLVMLAGKLEVLTGGNGRLTWVIATFVVAGLFAVAFIYHGFMLPRPASDGPKTHSRQTGFLAEFFRVFVEFFRKDRSWLIIAFLLLYRANEGMLVKLYAPFLLDPRSVGGLGLTTVQLGFAKGTVGVIGLLAGGIIGGIAIAKKGLQFWLWPMVLIIHLSDLAYITLAYTQPESLALIAGAVGLEQFGYGFSFTAYMMFMIKMSEGEHKTAHYAICTGFMALSMMLPGMFSGWLQELLGYKLFFMSVLLTVIPAVIVVILVKLSPHIGKMPGTAGAGFPVLTPEKPQTK